jgi:hypothetical protein
MLIFVHINMSMYDNLFKIGIKFLAQCISPCLFTIVCFSMNFLRRKVQKKTALPTLCCKKMQELVILVLVL